ncbi:hypothetical protein JNJ66_04490 [Candidatus Saccharibacteria bacterium]|nr:hypothetical protein [Candidatus Saccharibacteria bacterium]
MNQHSTNPSATVPLVWTVVVDDEERHIKMRLVDIWLPTPSNIHLYEFKGLYKPPHTSEQMTVRGWFDFSARRGHICGR